MLPRLPAPAPAQTRVPPPITIAQLADEGVTLPAITAWVVAQPVGRMLVTPRRPCLVGTALSMQLRDAGWDVRVRTSYHTASVRDYLGWLLAQPWFPADVHTLLQLLDTAVRQDPIGTLSRETCLRVLGQLALQQAGCLP